MGITSSTALWYASRATGVVALVLLTVVVVLGILVNRRGRLPGLPRFATTSLHRSMSLLAVAFTAVHVITAIADPYVTIGIAAAIIPFTSAYKAALARARRGVAGHHHRADCHQPGQGAGSAAGPGARCTGSPTPAGRSRWLHSIGSSSDLRSGGLLALTVLCTAAVAGATGWRVASAVAAPRRAERAARRAGQRGSGCAAAPATAGPGPRPPSGRPLTGAGAR